jgi:hypothetical protein
MSDESLIGKVLEGSGRDLIEVVLRHFPGRTKESTEILHQDMRCSG